MVPHRGRRGRGGAILAGKLKSWVLGTHEAEHRRLDVRVLRRGPVGVYGWPLAAGLVLSIYIHEMGHVAMLKRLRIEGGGTGLHSRASAASFVRY